MELIGVLFVLGFTGLVLLLPVVAFFTARSANERARRFEARLELLEERAVRAERRAAAMDARLSAFQAQTGAPAAATSFTPPVTAAPVAPAPPVAAGPVPPVSPTTAEPPAFVPPQLGQEPAPVAAPARAAAPPPLAPSFAAPVPPPVSSPAPSSPVFDWERLVGVRLFAWLGGAALFLAAALFLHYSIQQNLVSPPVRVASGLLFGALCLFGGDRLREKTPLAAHALCGAGVAILYAALFAARSLYGLINAPVAFAGMALVTVTAGLFAIRRNAYFVALLGLLGGMATPYLLSTGQDRPISLFLYVALLSAGVVFVAGRQSWPSLGLLGLASAGALFVGWSARYLVADRAAYALFALTLVSAVYALRRFTAPVTPAASPGLARGLGVISVLMPFLGALALGRSYELPPLALSAHLVAVSGLTWFIGKRHALSLGPLAAVLCVLAWMLRIDADLFPALEQVTFASLLLLPAAYFMAFLIRRSRFDDESLALPLGIVLAGAAPIVMTARAALPYDGPFTVALIYAALNSAGLIACGALLRRGVFLLLAQVVMLASLAICGATAPSTLQSAAGMATIVSGIVLFALPLAGRALRADALSWLSSGLALPLHFALLYAFVAEEWGNAVMGVASLFAGALSVALLIAARGRPLPKTLELPRLRALFGGGALAFLTAAVPILLENEWLTVSWALEVLAVCWLFRRVPERGLLLFAGLLALAVGGRLLFNPALWTYHERSATPFFNHYLYTFGVPVAAFFGAARLLRNEAFATRLRLQPLFGFLGTVLLFMLLNVEIADYFSSGTTLTFRWSGGGGLAEDMSYSLGWGAFGIGLLIAGIALGQRPARIGALAVLVLTIGKVFLHDLWELGSLYRVGSIVGLAVALLGVSYLTQRFILTKERA